ncbi:unnamed protein product [Arctia plantaginis]|uniref:Pre-C2HC domain-containing protein n=1 Tax=Arctia plantaginis TaxID=874455 RepID=A0A8S1A196_ARCPL|nr:unnamed protein product [Arctia plantaginis]
MPKKDKKKERKDKKNLKKTNDAAAAAAITAALLQCNISPQPMPKGDTILSDEIEPNLLSKWPKLRLKVPPIFLHQPVDFEHYVKKILNKGIKFYQPNRGKVYTRIMCETFNDHKRLTQYFDKEQIPYHTFGNPTKRKMKVVIRGLPEALDLDEIKETLKSNSIPIIRLHKMKTGEVRRDNSMLVLAVVPHDEKGKHILRVKQLLGHKVVLEPPRDKPKQCYRCQKWGHSQRYCHGQVKCVKCGENHLTQRCQKKPEERPKCANCKETHTASFRDCVYTRGSYDYSLMQFLGLLKPCFKPRVLVTDDNYTTLYRNVDYDKKKTKTL